MRRLEEDTNRDYAIDGTERRRRRPKDPEQQKKYYSGKTKSHSNKNDIIVGLDEKDVTHLSDTVEGKKSDKKLADEGDYKYPEGTNLFQDAGFQGYKPEGVNIFQPMKKPKGGELPAQEKEINSIISGLRVPVEHVIAGIKRLRILSDVFRNTKDGVEDIMMEIGCGLHNFRIALRGSSA